MQLIHRRSSIKVGDSARRALGRTALHDVSGTWLPKDLGERTVTFVLVIGNQIRANTYTITVGRYAGTVQGIEARRTKRAVI